jgi:glyoxylase-like metal-dependent hydrolase (beta-lactamase superfamily II)
MQNIYLKQMEIGPMQNFQYFIGCQRTRQIAVVDPAWDMERLLSEAENDELEIRHILLTHGHPDHMEGAAELSRRLEIPVYISENEAPFYMPHIQRLRHIIDGQKIPIGKVELQCIATPGHTPGCMCFRIGDILLTGDTLFIDGCGRCDLPGGDPQRMYDTLYHVIKRLPDDLIIYPGHSYGPSSFCTLGKQKQTNPYLTCKSKKDFLEHRMGY